VRFDVADPLAVAAFWAALLDREVRTESGGAWLPGNETQVGLRFVSPGAERVARSRMHLHLTSRSREDQRSTVERALRLGGRHLDVGQGSDATHVVLSDPGGNELCVIEPGNNFLAGTGCLGEVTCDGSRRVGTFWSDALGWPLVWDHNEQTAIQSPVGGTKISWDRWADRPPGEATSTTHVFDLVTGNLVDETKRLIALGGFHVSDLSDGVELADPDGNRFRLRAD
jgi:hypothetical protein